MRPRRGGASEFDLTFHPDAQVEFDEAYDWLEKRWAGSGDKFEEAIDASLNRIAANPRMHAANKNGVRRATIRGYRYYVLYYRECTDEIEVLSVFHTEP